MNLGSSRTVPDARDAAVAEVSALGLGCGSGSSAIAGSSRSMSRSASSMMTSPTSRGRPASAVTASRMSPRKRSLMRARTTLLGTPSTRLSPEISTAVTLESHICQTASETDSRRARRHLSQIPSISSTAPSDATRRSPQGNPQVWSAPGAPCGQPLLTGGSPTIADLRRFD